MKFLSSRLHAWLIGGAMLVVIASYANPINSATDNAKQGTHKHHQIEITGFEFVPKALKVAPGDIVTWVNKDIVPHNIINSDDKKAISPDLATSEKFSYKVPSNLPNTVDYFCGFHPSMTGKLSH